MPSLRRPACDGCCNNNKGRLRAGRAELPTKGTVVACTRTLRCCSGGVPVFDGIDPRYKGVLWTVIGINGAMFLTEMRPVGWRVACVEGRCSGFPRRHDHIWPQPRSDRSSLRTRATAALFKGLSLSAMALWVFGSTVYQTLMLGVPSAEVMGMVGLLALVANLTSVALLMRYKDGDANVRSVWLCSRNDAIGNVVVMARR